MSHDPNNYCIKYGYNNQADLNPYGDSADDSLIYQREVYKYARDLIVEKGLSNIVDIGCGHGTKLNDTIYPACKDIVGIDGEDSITYCRKTYRFGQWYVDDIESPRIILQRKFDLILSSDVIEHLCNPDTLFAYMKQFATLKTFIIISTPERDLRRGPESKGPPGNRAHVREWNKGEFHLYLVKRGVRILEHKIVDLREGIHTCQLALCQFEDHGQLTD